jgi:predicted nicotinamide N-methyase
LASPAYWCFCWASGQVLAQYLLAHPERVEGKSILDFGAGSGVVGIAAMLAGAREVVAVDLDPAALAACAVNAAINGVQLTLASDLDAIQMPIDLIIAADVLYDRDNLLFLEALPTLATEVLIADSRIKNFNHPHYRLLQTQTATTWPDLEEHPEYNQVRVFEHYRST